MNTLAMTDKLQAAGIPEHQARAQVEVLEEAMENVVTKGDLREMEARLQASMAKLQADLAKLILQATIGSLVALTAIFSFVVKTLLTVN